MCDCLEAFELTIDKSVVKIEVILFEEVVEYTLSLGLRETCAVRIRSDTSLNMVMGNLDVEISCDDELSRIGEFGLDRKGEVSQHTFPNILAQLFSRQVQGDDQQLTGVTFVP